MRKRFIDKNSKAEVEGNIKLSKAKWRDIGKIYGLSLKNRIRLRKFARVEAECLNFGSVEPAVVMCTSPLLVAVYSEDMDAVLILQFAPAYKEKYNLKVGDKLISVNTYGNRGPIAKDIFTGPAYTQVWTDFTPHIADFLSNDKERLERLKGDIVETHWEYVKSLGGKYIYNHPTTTRNGFWFINKRL
ncbi:MAG: hypothetical protein J6D23_00595 [Clostridia bacterium]|nr:hypothetical protein [Clostridia bacterium]